MESYTIILFILAIVIGLSAIAERFKIPTPVFLIIAGIAVGFIPHMPPVALNPEIVFLIFLPPLLYDAAFNISFASFRTHLYTISTLAISLVFVTTAGIAAAAHFLIPGISWPMGFVLGAILSATDSVAAMGITKGLKLPHKTAVILEGESLVNDASALIAYRFAVAAVTGAVFVFWKAWFDFVLVLGGGFLVGIVMGKVLAVILRRVKDNPMVSISFMLLMPFVTYLVAEVLHISGVIAVVILGLGISRFSRKIFPEDLKSQSAHIWEIIIFLLNGLIFILIGLQFPYIINSIPHHQILPFIGYSFIIAMVALIIRLIRVFWQQANLQKGFEKGRGKITEKALLDVKSSLVISWSGMRGIVSLAIAIGLPRTLVDGSPFPERNTIVFISIVVVLITLIGQGLSLPWLIKYLGVDEKAVPSTQASETL